MTGREKIGRRMIRQWITGFFIECLAIDEILLESDDGKIIDRNKDYRKMYDRKRE
jgi:CMP-N-acetylneuraminic acid synthetase